VEGTVSNPVGYLEGIYVKKEFRLRGVSKELLIECEAWAKDKGCSEFASDCELNNTESLKFHLQVGFEEVNRIICFKKML
jgi:aminoglycoside 6'-N-acetyltransferase I